MRDSPNEGVAHIVSCGEVDRNIPSGRSSITSTFRAAQTSVTFKITGFVGRRVAVVLGNSEHDPIVITPVVNR